MTRRARRPTGTRARGARPARRSRSAPRMALRYLDGAGRAGATHRKAELDELDEAALGVAPTRTRYTGDMMLSMALWKAVADRYDLLVATWDSRPGRRRRARAALDPDLGPARRDLDPASRCRTARPASAARSRSRCPRPAGCPTRWPASCGPGCARPVGRRRAAARLRSLRAAARADPRPGRPRAGREPASRGRRQLDRARPPGRRRRRRGPQRGADVGGLLGPLEIDAALRRARPDRRRRAPPRATPDDEARARRAARRARGPRARRSRDLAARCVGAGRRRPRARRARRRRRSGRCPTTPPSVDAYLARLGRGRPGDDAGPGRRTPRRSRERDELRGRLERLPRQGRRPRGARRPAPTSPSCAGGPRAALDREPGRPGARPARSSLADLPAPTLRGVTGREHARRRRRRPHDDHACTQPGCTGTIVDGYCDVCGMRRPTRRATGAPAADRSPAAARLHRHDRRRLLRRLRRPAAARRRGRRLAGHASAAARRRRRVDRRSRRVQPARLDRARLGPGGAARRQVTRRVGTSSTAAARRAARRRPHHVPPVPAVDAAKAMHEEPEVPEDKRFCPTCGAPVGRSRDGQPGRTEGFCPKCRSPFSFTPKLQAGDLVGGQYEVAGCHRARRPRLDLPRPRPQRLRPLGRAQGPAQHRRRRRARRRDRRAAVPRPGGAPADRRDLQLRRARGRRLHRHGVRRRHARSSRSSRSG